MVQFCDDCGSMMTKADDEWYCTGCDADALAAAREAASSGRAAASLERSSADGTELETIPTTDSGSVRKRDALRWLESLDVPTDVGLRDATVSKPYGFEGSTFAEPISNVRITGDPTFIETFAGLLKPFLSFGDADHRLEIALQRVENRDTGGLTENDARYLSVADRA